MSRQLEHQEAISQTPEQNIYVICDGIRTPENIGMIFRICEAMGTKKIFFSGSSPNHQNIKVKKVSRNTVEKIDFEYTNNIPQIVNNLKATGCKITALEITDTSKNIGRYNFGKAEQIAIIIGSERDGIAKEILKTVDESVHIPMFGNNSSMNVATALGICLYEIRKQEKNNKPSSQDYNEKR